MVVVAVLVVVAVGVAVLVVVLAVPTFGVPVLGGRARKRPTTAPTANIISMQATATLILRQRHLFPVASFELLAVKSHVYVINFIPTFIHYHMSQKDLEELPHGG